MVSRIHGAELPSITATKSLLWNVMIMFLICQRRSIHERYFHELLNPIFREFKLHKSEEILMKCTGRDTKARWNVAAQRSAEAFNDNYCDQQDCTEIRVC